MLLRHYLEEGRSKSALARQLGVSRDTIHRRIREGDLDRDLETMPVHYGFLTAGALAKAVSRTCFERRASLQRF
jgi:transposase-like protein